VRLLVVDDDRAVREALRRTLTLAGYEVEMAEHGEGALEQIVNAVPDAVVLDIGLPGIDGLEVCRQVRRLGNRVPILVLTARDAISDRIDGLDVGADDYMVKPFDVGELKARLRALLRRSQAQSKTPTEADGALSFAEYQLLELLMLNPRVVLSHSVIYDRVWGYDFGPTSNALRVYVGYLRRKLEDAGARNLIHTVRGVGYSLREP